VVVGVHAVAEPVQAVSQFVQAVAQAAHRVAIAEVARLGWGGDDQDGGDGDEQSGHGLNSVGRGDDVPVRAGRKPPSHPTG
jgi:hypothetical protein